MLLLKERKIQGRKQLELKGKDFGRCIDSKSLFNLLCTKFRLKRQVIKTMFLTSLKDSIQSKSKSVQEASDENKPLLTGELH